MIMIRSQSIFLGYLASSRKIPPPQPSPSQSGDHDDLGHDHDDHGHDHDGDEHNYDHDDVDNLEKEMMTGKVTHTKR